MPCPHGGEKAKQSAFSRRGFLAAALAIGSSSALSACLERQNITGVNRGPSDQSTLPARLFMWNEWLPHGPHGNPVLPGHQLILFWNYDGDGTPDDDERYQVEQALRSVDRAYQRGTGDEFNPSSTDGLLYLIGYSPAYFDRYDQNLPTDIDLQQPREIIDTLDESATADTYDVVMTLMSDKVPVLLSVEQALLGKLDTVNGVEMTSLNDVLNKVDRRTGFLGQGRPAEELSVDAIPEASPNAMGFKSSFQDNQAAEDVVTIPEGRFAGGSTLQLSRLLFNLETDRDGWYDRDKETRTQLMFSPNHDTERVGQIGERLAGKSQIESETVEEADQIARDENMVGHTQKVAAARDGSFAPRILRRSEGVSTDLPEPSMNFLSLQRGIQDFVETREAMNGAHIDAEVSDENDGIQDYVSVRRRGTFLVPPRHLRAFPRPRRRG